MSRYSDLSELRGELNAINQEKASNLAQQMARGKSSEELERLAVRYDDLCEDAAKLQAQIEDIEGDLASAERSSDRADYHRRVL